MLLWVGQVYEFERTLLNEEFVSSHTSTTEACTTVQYLRKSHQEPFSSPVEGWNLCISEIEGSLLILNSHQGFIKYYYGTGVWIEPGTMQI
jgi:hypothetical protein